MNRIMRYIKRKDGLTLFQLIGLLISFLTLIILSSYVFHAKSYDKFHSKHERIFRFTVEEDRPDGSHHHYARSFQRWRKYLPDFFPEIEEITEIRPHRRTIVSVNEHLFYTEKAFIVDTSFMHIFDLEIVESSLNEYFTPGSGVVISSLFAEKYFGNENPIGKTIKLTGSWDVEATEYIVSGVAKSFPVNSHFHFDILLPYNQIPIDNVPDWAWTYGICKERTNISALMQKMPEFVEKHAKKIEGLSLKGHLQPLIDIHLNSHKRREFEKNGNAVHLKIMVSILIGIIIITLFNYINLNILGFQQRKKGLVIKQVVGCKRKKIMHSYMRDKLLFYMFTLVVGILLFVSLSNSLKSFGLPDYSVLGVGGMSKSLLPLVLVILLLTITSLIPFVIQPLKAIDIHTVFIGKNKQIPFSKLSNAFLMVQFTVSAVIIFAGFVFYKQLKLIDSTSLVDEKKQVLVFDGISWEMKDRYYLFKEEATKISGVEGVTATFEPLLTELNDQVTVKGGDIEQAKIGLTMPISPVDESYFDLMNISIVAGDNFPKFNSESETDYYIINESAVKHLGYASAEDAVGRYLEFNSYYDIMKGGRIIGVVKDFHIQTMHHAIKPLVFWQAPVWYWCMMVAMENKNTEATKEQLNDLWKEIFPKAPFEYVEMEDMYAIAYKKEKQETSMLLFFSLVCIVISCLGLFALVSQNIIRKTKEIGIRKVNGAKIWELIYYLLRSYFTWITVAIVISFPLAFYISKIWLENFVYRTTINWWIYLVTSLLVITIVVITVGYRIWKAASRNPVEALRYE